MLSEGKTGKYFKYAIGEIILVVIGILIALQVNNLNESRKDRIKEQTILIQLEKEFKANLVQLDNKIANRNSIVEAGKQILTYLDDPSNNEESLMENISILTVAPTFNPIENDLINSGKIELIQNQSLKRILTEWPTYVLQLGEIETEYVGNYRNILLPLVLEIGIGREIDNAFWENEENFIFLLDKKEIKDKPQIEKVYGEIDFNKIINNKKFEGVVSNAMNINYIGNLESKSVRKRIIRILDLLKKEIK